MLRSLRTATVSNRAMMAYQMGLSTDKAQGAPTVLYASGGSTWMVFRYYPKNASRGLGRCSTMLPPSLNLDTKAYRGIVERRGAPTHVQLLDWGPWCCSH